ncbi:MAG: isoprenylcysteine carboxylmethyltransferase family protein [Planctomycetota bacterium]|nr:isoprenylcysteine carboxylmethyltransferase family protein [Planctomycetota bacterium]
MKETPPDHPRTILTPMRLVIGFAMGLLVTLIYSGILFGVAGRLDLPTYWAYIAISGVLCIVGFTGIDPGLLRERIRPGQGGKDQIMIPFAKLALTAHLVVSALDVGRYHFSDTIPLALEITGLVLFTLGLALTVYCLVYNKFFSSVVRIQEDRGHTLVSTGPYAIVRHPGYTGMITFMIGSCLALGSWWGGLPAIMFIALILRRLRIEDRFLKTELEGYEAYMQRVRSRLVPCIW